MLGKRLVMEFISGAIDQRKQFEEKSDGEGPAH